MALSWISGAEGESREVVASGFFRVKVMEFHPEISEDLLETSDVEFTHHDHLVGGFNIFQPI